MDMELIFKLLIMVIQLAVVCMVGAWVGDHIVQPMLEKRQRRQRRHG